MQVQIDKLLQVRSDNRVRINEDDLLEVHREEHIQEEDLVRPDDALLLVLGAQPLGPLVRHKLVLEVVLLRELRDEFLAQSEYGGEIRER